MKVLFTKREFLDNGICIIGKITCKNNGQVYREQLFYKDFNGDKNTLIELLNIVYASRDQLAAFRKRARISVKQFQNERPVDQWNLIITALKQG